MNSFLKRLAILTAATALPVTLLTVPFASPAQATPEGPYSEKRAGLQKLQALTPSPNEFSLSVAPQVGWDAGLEDLTPPAAPLYRLWDMAVAWKDVNPSPGLFEWSVLDRRVLLIESWGGRPFLVLGLTPQWAAQDPSAGDPRWGVGTASPPTSIEHWNNYVSAVANRYGNRIAGYELWNEANLRTFWQGTPQELYSMAKSASSIIKAVSPAAIVAAPSTTTRLRGSANRFITEFAGEITPGTKGPFDAWTIHSYPNGAAGKDFDNGTQDPREAANVRVDDILSWQNALVDAVGSHSPSLKIDIYDTEVNYGLAGPGIVPGTSWSAEESAELMKLTYQDSKNLGIDSTFWYQYTATPYSLLGVQWNPENPGLNDTWNSFRAGQRPPMAAPPLSQEFDYAVPVFKNCFIRPGSDCSKQNLKAVDFSGADLTDMNFTGAYMLSAQLNGAILNGTNLTNAYLKSAGMRNLDLIGFSGLKFGARSFREADFRGSFFMSVRATNTDFYKTKWNDTAWDRVDFSSSNFTQANFTGLDVLKLSDMRNTRLGQSTWKEFKWGLNIDFTGSTKCPTDLNKLAGLIGVKGLPC